MSDTTRVNLDAVKTNRKGFVGIFELLLRKYKASLHFIMLVPLYFFAGGILGLGLAPGVYFGSQIMSLAEGQSEFIWVLALSISIGTGYFSYGLTMVFLIPILNFVMRAKLHSFRGPYYSAATFKWYIHNGLTYLVRYTFLEFITPSPFNTYFYRRMGMKVGKGAQINSSCISDPSMIEIGDKVTVGGSATIVAHYGASGFLVIEKTKIGNGVTIGLRATIMGGVTIGDKAKILPNSVVMPKTVVPAGEIWGGVPARKIDKKDLLRQTG